MPPRTQPCKGCRQPVFTAEDIDTRTPTVLDAEPLDGGDVEIWTARGRAACRRSIGPARRQPASQLHLCQAVAPPPLFDPYADTPAAIQQHGGWR